MSTHRLTDLIGMHVQLGDGSRTGQVVDVRMTPSDRVRGVLTELEVSGIVVGRARPGTLLGYDRHPDQGPWLVRTVVRWLHRHTGYVDWADVEEVDWASGLVRLRTDHLRDLTPAQSP